MWSGVLIFSIGDLMALRKLEMIKTYSPNQKRLEKKWKGRHLQLQRLAFIDSSLSKVSVDKQ